MSGVQEKMRGAVEAIQTWLADTPKPGEAVVRQAIVLRVLHAAGFDIWNPGEVVPEETNGSGNRSDFLIRAGKGKFALELKGAGIALKGKPYEQVVTYAAGEGTRWAMLTNGRMWVVLDRMHNPGGKFEEHEVLKLELNQEGHTFADDLAALLDAETWRADAFAGAVEGIKSRQQQRLDEARVRREKMPVVKMIQAKFKIPTIELAAAAAIEMNLLTEAERDVLLGVPTQTTQEIHFTYCLLGAEAHAIYRPADGTWTVQAGSTALNRVLGENGTNARGIEGRRHGHIKAGQLVEKNAELLEYVQDVTYKSPSAAAMDISGASRNGWECWKDAQGRPAQHYRPE